MRILIKRKISPGEHREYRDIVSSLFGEGISLLESLYDVKIDLRNDFTDDFIGSKPLKNYQIFIGIKKYVEKHSRKDVIVLNQSIISSFIRDENNNAKNKTQFHNVGLCVQILDSFQELLLCEDHIKLLLSLPKLNISASEKELSEKYKKMTMEFASLYLTQKKVIFRLKNDPDPRSFLYRKLTENKDTFIHLLRLEENSDKWHLVRDYNYFKYILKDK